MKKNKLYFTLVLSMLVCFQIKAQTTDSKSVKFFLDLSAAPGVVNLNAPHTQTPFTSFVVGYQMTKKMSLQIGTDYLFNIDTKTNECHYSMPISLGAGYYIVDKSDKSIQEDNRWKMELNLKAGIPYDNTIYDVWYYDLGIKVFPERVGYVSAGIKQNFYSQRSGSLFGIYVGFGVRL